MGEDPTVYIFGCSFGSKLYLFIYIILITKQFLRTGIFKISKIYIEIYVKLF